MGQEVLGQEVGNLPLSSEREGRYDVKRVAHLPIRSLGGLLSFLDRVVTVNFTINFPYFKVWGVCFVLVPIS